MRQTGEDFNAKPQATTNLMLGKNMMSCNKWLYFTSFMRTLPLALLIAVAGSLVKVSAQTWMPTSAPTNIWSSIAGSADGSKLFACAGGAVIFNRLSPIYVSTNSGALWMQTAAPSNYWTSIASSADGTKLVAGSGIQGKIYTSSDGGLTWVSNNVTSQAWRNVASSADGTRLFAASSFGLLYTTTNAGIDWFSNAISGNASAITCSADGKKLLAGNSGYLYTSIDSGVNWMTNTSVSPRIWWSVAMSADGKTMMAVDGKGGPGSHVFTSTNFGSTWNTNNVPFAWSWQNVALSADGTKMIAAAWYSSGVPVGPVYTSTNSGSTWVSNNIPNSIWLGVVSSADGSMMAAVSAGTNSSSIGKGNVWLLQDLPSPILNICSSNDVRVSWTVPSANFILQQSMDLMNWSNVADAPTLNLNTLQEQITFPASDGNSFFRLKTP